MKLELLTNATVVNDAMRFLSDFSSNKKKLISVKEENDDKESKEEADYNDEYSELEETQEEGIGELTTNTVFLSLIIN
jgi:hypothetical protein